MKSKLYPTKLLVLLIILLIICIIILLKKKFTNKEYFINSCTDAPVIKALTMINTYTASGNNTERNLSQQNDPSFIADLAFNQCIDDIYIEAAQNTTLYTNNLDFLHKYAVEDGFLGEPSPQGKMHGCLNYCKLSVHYLFYLKKVPNYDTDKKTQIKTWLDKMYTLYGPTMKGRTNNQYVLYCLCGLINNELNNINSSEFSSKLLEWIEREFKDGYIVSETNRNERVVTYHYYTLNLVNSALLLMRFSDVSFNYDQIKDEYIKVVNNLTAPTIYNDFVKKFSKPSEPNMIRDLSDTSKLNHISNYIYNNTPLPSMGILTALEIKPRDLQIAVIPSSARTTPSSSSSARTTPSSSSSIRTTPSSSSSVRITPSSSSIPRTVILSAPRTTSSSAPRTTSSSAPRTTSSSARRTTSSSAPRTTSSSARRTTSSSAPRTTSSSSYSAR